MEIARLDKRYRKRPLVKNPGQIRAYKNGIVSSRSQAIFVAQEFVEERGIAIERNFQSCVIERSLCSNSDFSREDRFVDRRPEAFDHPMLAGAPHGGDAGEFVGVPDHLR